MKKTMMICMIFLLGMMSACTTSTQESTPTTEEQTQQKTEETNKELAQVETPKMLVAYFTYAENAQLSSDVDVSSSASIQRYNDNLTGNVGLMAHAIADLTGAELFSILTINKYPDNYDDTVDQGQQENTEQVRPELAAQIEKLQEYDVIFLGYPNWWYDMPMAMYSFLEAYDLSGKTIVPFSTSGGSGFSDTIETITAVQPQAILEEGLTIHSSNIENAQEDVQAWLKELGYIE